MAGLQRKPGAKGWIRPDASLQCDPVQRADRGNREREWNVNSSTYTWLQHEEPAHQPARCTVAPDREQRPGPQWPVAQHLYDGHSRFLRAESWSPWKRQAKVCQENGEIQTRTYPYQKETIALLPFPRWFLAPTSPTVCPDSQPTAPSQARLWPMGRAGWISSMTSRLPFTPLRTLRAAPKKSSLTSTFVVLTRQGAPTGVTGGHYLSGQGDWSLSNTYKVLCALQLTCFQNPCLKNKCADKCQTHRNLRLGFTVPGEKENPHVCGLRLGQPPIQGGLRCRHLRRWRVSPPRRHVEVPGSVWRGMESERM